MPKIELQTVARGKPIVCPRLRSLPFSANPTPDQISVVCVPASPCKVEIIKAVPDVSSNRVIRVNAFYTQIQLGAPWKLRHMQPGVPRGTVEIPNRRKLVIRKAIAIKREPPTQLRKAI